MMIPAAAVTAKATRIAEALMSAMDQQAQA